MSARDFLGIEPPKRAARSANDFGESCASRARPFMWARFPCGGGESILRTSSHEDDALRSPDQLVDIFRGLGGGGSSLLVCLSSSSSKRRSATGRVVYSSCIILLRSEVRPFSRLEVEAANSWSVLIASVYLPA
jgi:hypothetical protein